MQVGRPTWALAPISRYLSYAIDTALLTAAFMLLTILPAAAFSNGWLITKLALLPAYIGLGWLALRGTGNRRLCYFAGALLAYVCMFAIAHAHNPLAPINLFLSN